MPRSRRSASPARLRDSPRGDVEHGQDVVPAQGLVAVQDLSSSDGLSARLSNSTSTGTRVPRIAARSQQSPAEIVADTLEHGHSLEWQERLLD